jgi:hypothetical protein
MNICKLRLVLCGMRAEHFFSTVEIRTWLLMEKSFNYTGSKGNSLVRMFRTIAQSEAALIGVAHQYLMLPCTIVYNGLIFR